MTLSGEGGSGEGMHGKRDWPQHWYSWMKYAAHKNPNLFNLPTLSDKDRHSESTVKMGFKCAHNKVEVFLQDILTDLKQAKGLRGVQVNFMYKNSQAFDCAKDNLTLLYGPTK